jgi:spoIIIJ-associated protein
MNEKELSESIEEIVKDFFNRAGSEADIKKISLEESEGREVLMINLKTKEANIFIGKQGLVLSDIQLLLRKIIKKKTDRDFFLNLDIDDYKKYKEDYIREMAQSAADEAVSQKEKKELPLAAAFDRRIVYLELSKRSDIKVESVGEGEERRIIITPLV